MPASIRRIFLSRLEIAVIYNIEPDSLAIYWIYLIWWKNLFVRSVKMLIRIQGRDDRLIAKAERKTKIIKWLSEDL